MLAVKVYPDLHSPHMTQVYSGLYDLARQGRITLEATSKFDSNIKKAVRNSVLCVQVSDTESRQMRTVCFDMFDGYEISSVERLRLCDVYLKRSYYDKYVDGLDYVDRRKIMPYGLNYECRSRNEREMLRRLFIFHSANGSFSKHPLLSLKDFSSGVLRYLLLKTDLDILELKPMSSEDFVVQPDEPAELKILLQTRLWTSRECPRISDSWLKEINDMRVNTVRSLKRRFGGQFLGGLLPTDAARRDYPDLCVPMESTRRRNYMDAVKKCLVCVTTTGLHDSIGFRLPEYLAASRCIVTEPLKYQLPVSLIEGTNYLAFRTPDECVAACERLLATTQLANQMRYENHKYYLNEVEPAALVYKCLTTAMSLQ